MLFTFFNCQGFSVICVGSFHFLTDPQDSANSTNLSTDVFTFAFIAAKKVYSVSRILQILKSFSFSFWNFWTSYNLEKPSKCVLLCYSYYIIARKPWTSLAAIVANDQGKWTPRTISISFSLPLPLSLSLFHCFYLFFPSGFRTIIIKPPLKNMLNN